MKRHCTAVLSAMMTGMDDRDDPDDAITLEAMTGLSKVLAKVEEDSVRAILINIALRIRPCFEKDKVRARWGVFFFFFFFDLELVWCFVSGGFLRGCGRSRTPTIFVCPRC